MSVHHRPTEIEPGKNNVPFRVIAMAGNASFCTPSTYQFSIFVSLALSL